MTVYSPLFRRDVSLIQSVPEEWAMTCGLEWCCWPHDKREPTDCAEQVLLHVPSSAAKPMSSL